MGGFGPPECIRECTRYALKIVVIFRAKVEFGQVVIVRKDRLQLVYMFGGGA